MAERESMPVDVVVVGAGPAGLAAAIRLKQLAAQAQEEFSIVVVEKAAEVGAHVLSGAVLDPSALDSLVPDWRDRGAPLNVEVTSDTFRILGKTGSFAIPNRLLPPLFSNHGNYITSLGEVCRWLGEQAESLGVDIFPGFAATEILYDENGAVSGIATGDQGVDRQGQPKAGFAPGMELHARYTLIAEGARGSLAKQLIARFDLARDSDPQHYGLGVKEIWRIPPERHRPGHVEHHLGWPLGDGTGGGGFVYHAADSQVYIGYVVHLDYDNPYLSPFEEMQRWKTHKHMRKLLEGGTRIGFGARALTEGGWQSIPELAFPGGALMGCSAGFMNVPRIKGSHNAMWSGIQTAEVVFEALTAGRGNDVLDDLSETITSGPIAADLRPVRNAKPLLKLGTKLGMLLGGFDLWTNTIFGRSLLGTLHSRKPDHVRLKSASASRRIDYPRPDGKLTFDRASSVFLANLAHEEDQPVHLRLRDPSIPIAINLPEYDEPAQRYCPAGVYEVVASADGTPHFQINAANCVHCKTCDIKDPAQNIDWVPPEGASGPNYQGM
jgi:electron-transferring-flavoprotein dehydrogenase